MEENVELCKLDYLKAKPKFYDALLIFMISMAANNGGSAAACGVSVKMEAPFMDANTGNCPKEVNTCYENIKTYMKTVIEGGPLMEENVKNA